MAARHKTTPDSGATPAPAPASRRDWKQRLILGGVGLVVLVVAYFLMATLIPRWWSQRVGKAVNGQLSTGAVLGVCLGVTFTLVPLIVLYLGVRRSHRWKTRGIWLLAAIALAAPNLWTLGVAIGTGSGSHAGQRTMDVEAPMFRGATLVGVLLAVATFIAAIVLLRRRNPKAPKPPKTPAAPPASPVQAN
jgi:hypothetical protein